MRNQFCNACKKKKQGGVVVNALHVAAPIANQKVALKEAITLYTACLEYHASNMYVCYMGRGECRLKLGDTEGAIDDMNAAIAEDGARTDAHKCRAVCYMQLERWSDAITDAMAVLELEPSDYLAKSIHDSAAQKLFAS